MVPTAAAARREMRLAAVFDDGEVVPRGDPLDRGMSAGWPYRCTGRIARVRGPMARSTASGSIVRRTGSMSANTGRAPVIITASAVYAADSGVVITSSPAPMPSARRISAMASVPVPTPTACARPSPRELRLEGLDLRPEHEPAASMTRSIAARTAARPRRGRAT